MMKWLRAHTKQIMVVVVLLAMFSFVGGSALVSMLAPNPAKEVFARAFATDITQGDISFANSDIEVLESLFYIPQQFKSQYGEVWQFGNRKLTPVHWYLLAMEAERGGAAVSDQEIDAQIAMFPPETMDVLRTQRGITPPQVRQALRRQMAIQKNANHILQSALPSEAEVKHYVVDTEDKIRIKFAAVAADRFVNAEAPIPAEEVQAHFAAYKNEDPTASESGFGYMHPRRVRLQYICANLNDISPQVQVSMEAIKSYWKVNKANYKKTIYVDADPTTMPADPTATQPAEPPPPQPKLVEKSFSEAQADVERELRQKNATQVAEQAMKKVQSLLTKPWEDVKTDPETGYKPIPAGADDREAMRAISDRVSKEFGIPLTYVETGLLAEADLMTEANLRGAYLMGAGPSATLAECAFRIAPFHKEKTEDDVGLWLQMYQIPDTWFTGMAPQMISGRFEYATQRLIIFRAIESREAEAPADLAEVREKVERDIRLLKGYQAAEPIAKELYAIASRLGLDKAMEMLPNLKTPPSPVMVTTPPSFPKRARVGEPMLSEALSEGRSPLGPPNVVGVGASEAFVDACFEMTEPGWTPPSIEIPETEQTTAATTQPALEPAPVVRIISLPKLRKHFVVELAGTEPVDEEKFASELRQSSYYRLMNDRGALMRSKWYDPAEIENRSGFERLTDPNQTGGGEGILPPRRLEPPVF